MKPACVITFSALSCLALASCKDREPAGEAEKATAESTPEVATASSTSDAQTKWTWHGDYVLKGTTLLRLQEDGTTEAVLSYAGASYCETDTRSGAIWLLGDAGLSVLDLESKALELVVAAEPGSIEAFEVRFGLDQGKVGNAEGLRDDVALIVVAAKRITLRSEIICEGARESVCYVDSSTDDPDLWELVPAAAAIKTRYDALKLSQTPLLLAMSARRLARSSDLAKEAADNNADAEGQGEDAQPAKSRLPVDGLLFCGNIERSPL